MDGREFGRGDQVRARGGPVMVVEEVYASVFIYRYRCTWVSPDGFPEHELFRAEQLELQAEPAG
jgi:uncharacterized protein YodC (DUF2158 family)